MMIKLRPNLPNFRMQAKVVRRLMRNTSSEQLAQLSETDAAQACLDFFPSGKSISIAFIHEVQFLARFVGQWRLQNNAQ